MLNTASLIKEINNLATDRVRPIIFITGPSGSGKTSLARDVADATRGICVSFDWWIKEDSSTRRRMIVDDYRQRGVLPNPLSWYDWDAFSEQIQTFQQSGTLHLDNAWDQASGEKILTVNLKAGNRTPIIVEGVYLFEPSISHLPDLKVLIRSDMQKSTLAALRRQAHRNPSEYLKIKELWYTQFDKPYFENHAKDADGIFRGWAA